MIVADASAVGTFLIPDEAGPFADYARDVCGREALHVPSHWFVEMASLIRKAHRRDRLSAAQAATASRAADMIGASVFVATTPTIEQLVSASERHGLTVYDGAYLLLALRLRVPLLTADDALARTAIEQGIEVLAP